MEKSHAKPGEMEKAFLTLPIEERGAIIRYGVALRLSHLKKRIFLAESKIQHFEEKYNTTLVKLDRVGLADDADVGMHEDYIMWRHWALVLEKTKSDIVTLEKMAQQGLYQSESANAGR